MCIQGRDDDGATGVVIGVGSMDAQLRAEIRRNIVCTEYCKWPGWLRQGFF